MNKTGFEIHEVALNDNKVFKNITSVDMHRCIIRVLQCPCPMSYVFNMFSYIIIVRDETKGNRLF